MDWRAATPQDVQDDFDSLLRDGVNAVARALGNADSFTPFMLVIDRSGRKGIRMSEHRPGSADEQTLTAALQVGTDRAELRARATVFDVTVSVPFAGAAIKAVLEHSSGLAIDVLVPYSATAEQVQIDLNAADAAVGTRRLWR
ncbi:hypothetical protein AB0H49_28390 [Nocardia sp. NPDC050713]|uniref:hypothetical protein n=1 Tax=Nocardia sp. NPDC050713 TaxID=3154511 RepID=UPI0033EAFC28